jgi:methyltransferase
MLIRLVICVAIGVARLAELRLSRTHVARTGEAREGKWSRRTYPVMVAIHIIVIGAAALRGGRARWPWLAIFFAVQPLRAWTLLTLRGRWNTRGAVSASLEIETGGPYALVRHPNYLVVFIELLTLPLAFCLRRFAWTMTLPHMAVLAIRIRDEEALLNDLPGYREHFARKARFVPKVF